MISAISNVADHYTQGVQASQSNSSTKAAPQQEDSVHLSSQAAAAAGDVDHDGDSH
ncbi:MAG: hypothetical protein JO270_08315 [Acidobacteriaceae bacterium]|nr:hypothetical protein [Acidobacteriaceae bacterium]MBV8570542.1 hypothetical protein [Acidobacteriaceae bacterium]